MWHALGVPDTSRRLRILLDSLVDVVVCIDDRGRILEVNPVVEVLLGWKPEELLGKNIAVLAGGGDGVRHDAFMGRYRDTGERRIIGRARRVRARHRSGLEIPVSLSVSEFDLDGQRLFTGVLRDARLEVEQEQELARQRDELRVQMEVTRILQRGMPAEALVDAVMRALIHLAELEVEAKAGWFAFEGGQLVLQQTVGVFGTEFLEKEARIALGACLCGRAAASGEVLVSEDCFHDPRHEHRFADMTAHGHYIVPLKAMGHVLGVIFLYTDPAPRWDKRRLTLFETLGSQIGLALHRAKVEAELAASRRQLEEMALMDSLTGVLNRRAFLDRVERERARARRDGAPLALLMLDLDHFKQVNDTHGHLAGDAVLCEAVARVRGALRPYDALGRYGGEEFVALLVGVDPTLAVQVAERVRASIATAPVRWEQREIPVTASVGVTAVGQGESLADAIARADEALYAAKAGGRNRIEMR